MDSAAVGDTEWHEVTCQDGRVYYYHPDTEVGGRAGAVVLEG